MTSLVFLSSTDDVVGHITRARGTRDVRIHVIVADGIGDRTHDGMSIVDVGKVERGRLARLLDRSVVTRTLVRLSPADGGLVLRRRIRRSTNAQRVLRESDVIVACERDAALTVWSAVRDAQGTSALGLYGIAAGLAELQRR